LLKLKSRGVRLGVLIALIAAQPLMRFAFAPEVSGFEDYFLKVRSLFHFSLDGLLVGVACAFAWADEVWREKIKARAHVVFAFGAALFLGIAVSGPLVDLGVSGFDKVALPTFLSVAFGAMVLGGLAGGRGAKIFEWKPLGFVALISYSLYLVHLPLLFLSEVAVRHFVNLDTLGHQAQFFAFLPVFFAISFMVATLLYVFVERPIINWSRK
jgi:peptidoglycan/LPS O-acetylase OafA/YrhL